MVIQYVKIYTAILVVTFLVPLLYCQAIVKSHNQLSTFMAGIHSIMMIHIVSCVEELIDFTLAK